jgi:methyl-accepting chemotaxis protein
MGQLNQLTQQNASASEELAATSEEMNGQADQLQRLMEFFRTSDSVASEPAAPTDSAPTAKVAAAPAAAKPAPAGQPVEETEFVRF